MDPTISTSDELTSHDSIAARAHSLWEASGRPHGRDMEFWLAAERTLRAVPPTIAGPTLRTKSAKGKARDVDGLGAKTEEMLSHTGGTASASPTALDLGPR